MLDFLDDLFCLGKVHFLQDYIGLIGRCSDHHDDRARNSCDQASFVRMGGVRNGEGAVLGIGGDPPFAPSVLGKEKVKETGSRETIVLIVISIHFRYPLYEYLPQAGEKDG